MSKHDPKQYELNVFRKRSAKLSRNIYKLPMDIKLIIFKLAMCNFMKRWRIIHRNNMKSWSRPRYIHGVLKPFSCLDLIKGWGPQAPKNNHFPHTIMNNSILRGSIPIQYKIKLCSRQNVLIDARHGGDPRVRPSIINSLNTHRFYLDRKCEKVARVYYQELIYLRVITGGGHWVHRKCRCLTCDLIRLYGSRINTDKHYTFGVARLDRESKHNKQKYNNIDYIDDGVWKTYTDTEINIPTKEKKLLRKCKFYNQ